jgi:hypothetical protein
MPRIGFVLTATAAAISCALAGYSALTFDRSQQRSSSPSRQILQFQSESTGTDVRSVQGQTCQTLTRIACRKPIGDICKERFPVAFNSDQRRSAASRAFLFLEKTATDLDTKSGQGGAPNGSATAPAASTAASAATTPAE